MQKLQVLSQWMISFLIRKLKKLNNFLLATFGVENDVDLEPKYTNKLPMLIVNLIQFNVMSSTNIQKVVRDPCYCASCSHM